MLSCGSSEKSQSLATAPEKGGRAGALIRLAEIAAERGNRERAEQTLDQLYAHFDGRSSA